MTVAHDLHAVMDEVRKRTFALVAHLDEAQLNAPVTPIMSPLSWDLGHMAAYEDLWLNHRAGRPGAAAGGPRGALRRVRDAAGGPR